MPRVNADQQIATLTARDILIVPGLGDITSSDFVRTREAKSTGHEAADCSVQS